MICNFALLEGIKFSVINGELVITDTYSDSLDIDTALILIPVITAAGLEVQSTSDSHAYSVKLLPAGMLEIH